MSSPFVSSFSSFSRPLHKLPPARTELGRRVCSWGFVALLALAGPAQAQMFKDNALQALHLADKPAELQRVARERLAAQPGDSQAVLALALAALGEGDEAARKTAITRAESCTHEQPQAAVCHYALGVVLGIQAMSEGMLKAARSVGTVKNALLQAQSLEPSWFPARSALLEFYLMAPGMLGGSTGKAQELARGAAAPEQARALQARIDLQEGRPDASLEALNTVLSSTDAALLDDVISWGLQAGAKLVNSGQGAKAQPFFERLMKLRPDSASGPYGLARVNAAAGAHSEAVKLYDRAALSKGAAAFPIDYRRGIALQELGRQAEARAALNRFVSAGKGQKSSLEDARKRLEQLGS